MSDRTPTTTHEAEKRLEKKPTVAEQTAGGSKLKLPKLPLGYYDPHARLKTDGTQLEIKRSFVTWRTTLAIARQPHENELPGLPPRIKPEKSD